MTSFVVVLLMQEIDLRNRQNEQILINILNLSFYQYNLSGRLNGGAPPPKYYIYSDDRTN